MNMDSKQLTEFTNRSFKIKIVFSYILGSLPPVLTNTVSSNNLLYNKTWRKELVVLLKNH